MDLMHLYENIGEWYREQRGLPQQMNSKLNSELATQLYRQGPSVSISIFVLLGLALYFFWNVLPKTILLTWAGANLFFACLLLLACWRYVRSGGAGKGQNWIQLYVYLALLQDLSWGLIGPISFMIDSEIYHLLTLFMLGGMSAGAIVTRGIVFKAYATSITSLLLPILVTLALQGNSLSEGMFALTLIYLLFMLSVAKAYSANIRKNILLWLDNEKLVGELRHSKAEVEDANQVLTGEIEQRKRIEEELVEAKERAERASMAKNQFLANVSHELRTPLNGIIGFTSLLERESHSEEHRGYISQVSKSANSLLRIVNDILDITSIEAGHLKLYEEPFALRTEIGEVLSILRPVAQKKSLRLNVNIDDEVSDNLIGDPNRLRQVISNLLSNALKYTEEGEVSLSVSSPGERDGDVLVRFEVVDTGIGIPPEAVATLFDNFTRVEGFETRHNDGVGLGLAIVKNLLQQMRGSISVDSEPGKGSCFAVDIPFARSVDGPAAKTLEPEPTQEEQVNLQSLRVLVVDDNDVNRMVLCAFLANNGVSYSESSTGYDALEQISENDFDVVLLDIQMPDISGIDVAREVMSMKRDIPALVAVTAHAFPEQRETIISAGFSEFLIKPISESGLVKTLSRIASGEQGGRAGSRVNV